MDPPQVSEWDLQNIFGTLKHLCYPENQESAQDYLNLFGRFISLRLAHRADDIISDDYLSLLAQNPVFFFERYGCAVISISSLGLDQVMTSHLHLLGLDCWTFQTHSNEHSESSFASYASNCSPLYMGRIATASLSDLIADLKDRLSQAEVRTGDQRNATSNKQGHQKTPAFIACIVQDALTHPRSSLANKIAEPQSKPRGGFTDVGLHTGGQKRNTAWPLARSVAHYVFQQLPRLGAKHDIDVLFRQTVLLFKLWLIKLWLKSIDSSFSYLQIDILMNLLECIVCDAVPLADNGHDVSEIENKLRKLRLRAEQLRDRLIASDVAKWSLPTGLENLNLFSFTHIVLPPAESSAKAPPHDAIRANELKNSGWLSLLLDGSSASASSITLSKILQWVNQFQLVTSSQSAIQLVLSTIETCFFERAISFLVDSSTATTQCEVPAFEFLQLEKVVEKYRGFVDACCATPDAWGGRMSVEIRSKETLVVWIAYCLVDKASASLFNELRSFSVSISHLDLRHLVLADKRACDSLRAVSTYLCSRTAPSQPPVFSLRSEDSSFVFALQAAVLDEQILRVLKEETASAATRLDSHWQQVQQAKVRLAELRMQLADLRKKEDESNLAYDRCSYNSALLLALRNNALSQRVSKEEEVKRASSAPLPLVQPLPSDRAKALCVLFFLFMPPILRVLARFSFMAQQMLVPRPAAQQKKDVLEHLEKLKLPEFAALWASHFNSSPSSRYSNIAQDGSVMLGSLAPIPKFERKQLDLIRLQSDCVYYPDNFTLELGWRGGSFASDALFGGSMFNPFAVSRDISLRFYTPQLATPHMSPSLQWALEQHDSNEVAATRGNESLARQFEKPQWLSKSEYLAFTSLRSYPHLQMRKICVALRQRSLPFGHEVVQLLIRSALYHVGTLAPQTPIEPLWKADLFDADILLTLFSELMRLVEELEHTPRDHVMLLFVLDVALYIRHWDMHESRDALRRKCLDIVWQWSRGMEERLPLTDDAKQIASLRALQCMYQMYGILAFGGSFPLFNSDDPAAVAELCKLIALAHQGHVFRSEAFDMSLFDSLIARMQNVICARMHEILAVVNSHLHILTEAVSCVLTSNVPKSLEWSELVVGSGTFHAESGGNAYTFNILTGSLLFNGLPPRSLPASVHSHPLYQRTFCTKTLKRDFEVVSSGQSGQLRTIRPLDGYEYEFHLLREVKSHSFH